MNHPEGPLETNLEVTFDEIVNQIKFCWFNFRFNDLWVRVRELIAYTRRLIYRIENLTDNLEYERARNRILAERVCLLTGVPEWEGF